MIWGLWANVNQVPKWPFQSNDEEKNYQTICSELFPKRGVGFKNNNNKKTQFVAPERLYWNLNSLPLLYILVMREISSSKMVTLFIPSMVVRNKSVTQYRGSYVFTPSLPLERKGCGCCMVLLWLWVSHRLNSCLSSPNPQRESKCPPGSAG